MRDTFAKPLAAILKEPLELYAMFNNTDTAHEQGVDAIVSARNLYKALVSEGLAPQ